MLSWVILGLKVTIKYRAIKRRQVMKDSITIVGMDVHKNSIQIALAETGESDEIRSYGRIGGAMAALGNRRGRSLISK